MGGTPRFGRIPPRKGPIIECIRLRRDIFRGAPSGPAGAIEAQVLRRESSGLCHCVCFISPHTHHHNGHTDSVVDELTTYFYFLHFIVLGASPHNVLCFAASLADECKACLVHTSIGRQAVQSEISDRGAKHAAKCW